MSQFFGKYRGKVTNNIDPEQSGRMQVSWVEFEGGDPNFPIWSGCFWGTGEVPALALATPSTIPHFLLQTTGQSTFLLSDAPGPTGGIMLKTTTGAAILINDTGITIQNGKGATIQMTGTSVMINGVALVIT